MAKRGIGDACYLPEHFIVYAGIYLGESLTLMNNLYQRKAEKDAYREVQLKLRQAIAALSGYTFIPAVDVSHASPSTLDVYLTEALDVLASLTVARVAGQLSASPVWDRVSKLLDKHNVNAPPGM
jgi:hypothetical protein